MKQISTVKFVLCLLKNFVEDWRKKNQNDKLDHINYRLRCHLARQTELFEPLPALRVHGQCSCSVLVSRYLRSKMIHKSFIMDKDLGQNVERTTGKNPSMIFLI